MKRFLVLLCIPLLAVSSVALLGSSFASATSPIDGFITTTNQLVLTNPSDSGDTLDATLFWYDYMISAYEKRCDLFPTSSVDWCGTVDWLNFNKQTDNFLNGSWYVVKSSDDSAYSVSWSNIPNATCDLNDIEIIGSGLSFYCEANQFFTTTIYYEPNSQYSSDLGVNTGTQGNVINISSGLVQFYAYNTDPIFISTFNYIYPPGYEGPIIPDRPVDPSPSATPEATLEVSTEGNLMVLPKTWLTMPKFATSGGELGANIEYILYGEDNTVLSSDVFTTTKRPFMYHLPGIGDYVMRVQYVHPGIPYAPWDPPPELGTLRFEFTYNGQYILIDGEGDHCSLDGDVLNCEGGTTYVDCGYHLEDFGVDSIREYVDCVIYNQQTWFKSLLTGFFVPSYTFYDTWFDDFDRFFAHQFGGVYQSTTMGAGLLIDVVDAGRTTRCVLSPDGTFFGSDFSVDFCVLDDVWPVGVTAMRVIVIGVTSVALLFVLLRKFNEVAKER